MTQKKNIKVTQFSSNQNDNRGCVPTPLDSTTFKHIYPKALCSCNFAESPPPGLSKRGMTSVMPFYADVKVILPLIVATIALVAAAIIVAFRWKNSESSLKFLLFYKIIFVN